MSVDKPDFWQTLGRSCRLRCPACGKGRIAKNWRETHDRCPACDFDFRVEGGFYLGSIYMNYGIMAAVLLGTGMPLVWFGYVSPQVASTVGVLLSIPMGVWLWRYARSLWLGLGYMLDHNVRAGGQAFPSDPSQPTPVEPPVGQDGASDEAGQQLDGSQEASTKQRLVCICPFCHQHLEFEESQARSWSACTACGQQVLLLPVRPAQPAEKQLEDFSRD